MIWRNELAASANMTLSTGTVLLTHPEISFYTKLFLKNRQQTERKRNMKRGDNNPQYFSGIAPKAAQINVKNCCDCCKRRTLFQKIYSFSVQKKKQKNE